MKVAVVYGTMHRGSTYHCVRLLLDSLSSKEKLMVNEFFLPADLPHFCSGCFSCFLNGEETCPHAAQVKRFRESFDDADLIILASPVYVCDVSGQMKALLDHFGYRWMPHRPESSMFHKLGVVISTAAGAGTGDANKTMKKSLVYWGIKRIYTFGGRVGAMSWEEVDAKRKKRIETKIAALGEKTLSAYQKRDRLGPRLFTKILFWLMKGLQKSNNWNPTDRDHWKKNGWLDGKKPW